MSILGDPPPPFFFLFPNGAAHPPLERWGLSKEDNTLDSQQDLGDSPPADLLSDDGARTTSPSQTSRAKKQQRAFGVARARASLSQPSSEWQRVEARPRQARRDRMSQASLIQLQIQMRRCAAMRAVGLKPVPAYRLQVHESTSWVFTCLTGLLSVGRMYACVCMHALRTPEALAQIGKLRRLSRPTRLAGIS